MPNFLFLPKNNAHDGMTMIELCVAATLMIIIGIGVSVAIRNTTEAFMEKRALQQETRLGLSIMSRLRQDIADAQSINVDGAGTLEIESSNGDDIAWSYVEGGAGLADNTLIRKHDAGGTVDLTEGVSDTSKLFITCASPCFSSYNDQGNLLGDGDPGVTRIEMNDFSVSHISTNPLYSSEVTAGAFETDTMVFHWNMGIEFQ